MIKITSQSVQNKIIQELFAQVSHKSPLFLELESLPYFLSSTPSLRVFLYKIQNYPREILWFSHDNAILEFLHQNQIPIEFPYNPQNAIVTTSSNSPVVINLNKNHSKNNSGNHYEKLAKLKAKKTIPNLDSESDYYSYSQKTSEKIDFKQDLDSWLQKIENTKESLSKFKNDVMNEKIIKRNNWFNNIFDGKWLYRVALSLFVISFATIATLYYPTNTYKIDVAPSIRQEAFDLQFSDSIFTKNRYNIDTQNEVDSTGINQIFLNEARSIGKVSLINNSLNNIDFNKEGIILISQENGLEYRQKAAGTDPQVFSIASKNNLNNQSLEIEIQAIDNNPKYNLPVGSNFRVYNLRGEAFGGNLEAIAVNDIIITNPTEEKTISQADLSLLRSKAESSLNDQKTQKLEELKASGELVNNNWIRNSDTVYKFDSILDEKKPKAKVEAQAQIEIYTVDQNKFKNLVSSQIKVSDITDIVIVDSRIDEKNIYAKVFLAFKQNQNIYKNDIIGNLANNNINEGTIQIQQKYPNVKRVSKDFTGFKLPMITPRSKVEVNELNIN